MICLAGPRPSNPNLIAHAWRALLSESDTLGHAPSYRFDLVDIASPPSRMMNQNGACAWIRDVFWYRIPAPKVREVPTVSTKTRLNYSIQTLKPYIYS